jgi:hypothetical protein
VKSEGFHPRKGLEGFSRDAQRRSDSGAPATCGCLESPVFCGKEAPLYGALKSKKSAENDRKKVNAATPDPGVAVFLVTRMSVHPGLEKAPQKSAGKLFSHSVLPRDFFPGQAFKVDTVQTSRRPIRNS